mgnify:CR=1 FL=1
MSRTLQQSIAAFSLGLVQDCITMYQTLQNDGYTMEDAIAYMEGLKTAYMMKMAIGNKELRMKLKEQNPENYKIVIEERKRQLKEMTTRSLQPDGSWKPCCKDKDKVAGIPIPPPPIPQNTINEVE